MAFFDNFFSRKDSSFRTVMSVGKLGRALWTPREYASFAKEAYSDNGVGYGCIRLISDAVSHLSIEAFVDGQKDGNHPALKLLGRPNPSQGQEAFLDDLTSYFLIAGNSYIEAVLLRGEPAEIYAHRPDRIKIILGANARPIAFEYSANGVKKAIPISKFSDEQQRMLHIKSFNPLDDHYGMSPVEAGSFSIDIHNSASNFNKALLDNAGSPSGAFVYEDNDGQPLPDKQYKTLKKNIDARFSGRNNAGKAMLLDGGLKWLNMGTTPKELEYSEGKASAAREIALAFGVPPQLLGIRGDNTYSNYAEANRAFYRQKVLPLAKRILGDLTTFFEPTWQNLELKVDLDAIPALASERREKFEMVKAADWMSIGEKRTIMGLEPYDPKPADPASHIMVNGGLMPIEDAVLPPEVDPNAGDAEPNEDE